MSIVTCAISREPDGQTATLDAAGQWRYSVTYEIVTSAIMGPQQVVIQAQQSGVTPNRLPSRGDVYAYDSGSGSNKESDSSCRARSFNVARSEPGSALKWRVVVEYEEPGEEAEQSGGRTGLPTNPLLWPPRYRMEMEQITEPFARDNGGRQVVNSVGSPLIIEVERSRPVLVVEKNYGSFAEIEAIATEYADAVNLNAYRGRGPGLWRVVGVSFGDTEANGGVLFVRATFRLMYKREGWAIRPLDEGFKVIKNGRRVNARDANGEVVTEPVALNANGEQVNLDAEPPEEPHYLEYFAYPPKDFATLGI